MTDTLYDFINEFDELASEARYAEQAFVEPRLKQWFNFLDTADDGIAAHIKFLEELQSWEERGKNFHRGRGFGGAKVLIPDDRNTRLGFQLQLF